MVLIRSFLKADNKTLFLHKETQIEYTKDELDIDFQFEQDSGCVTIKEYIERLTNFLNQFKITKQSRSNQE